MKPLTREQQKKIMKALSLTIDPETREILCKIEHGDLPYNEGYLLDILMTGNQIFSLKFLNKSYMEWALEQKGYERKDR